jgi:[acyl-carrier-protein] S-malonyltransferase
MDLTGQRAAAAQPAVPRREVVLLFPGQGSQYSRMGTGLYQHDPVFTASVEAVFAALGGDGARLRADWLGSDPADPLSEITRSQPLLFAIGYALGQMVRSWGVRPAAMLGHSIGEVVAATVAGVFAVDDAARLVWGRVRSLARAPRGGMLAVAAPERSLLPYLDGTDVAVGVVNAPGQTVLSGPDGPLRAVHAALRRDRFRCRPVPTNTGLHSPVLEPFTGIGARVFAGIETRPPRLRVYSCYTTAPLTPELATSADFWVRQPMSPVRFWPALEALLRRGTFVLVEAGPGRGLTGIARRHPAVRSGRCTLAPLLPAQHQGAAADRAGPAGVLGQLRSEGLCAAGSLVPAGAAQHPALALAGRGSARA